MIASEIAPLAKTGGLADVLSGLSTTLCEFGHTVKVVIPYYPQIRNSSAIKQESDIEVVLEMGGRTIKSGVVRISFSESCEILCLDCDELYGRPGIYVDEATKKDYPDNDLRFGFFSKAALELARAIKFKPHVIHAHDWQAGLTVALKYFAKNDYFKKAATVFTIHNLAYQGLFPKESMELFGLPDQAFDQDSGVALFDQVSLLKAGLAYADAITTVSEKYAMEIQTEELGFAMDGFIKARAEKLTGITNGVDYSEWNPKTDRFIAGNYSAKDLSGKAECKKDLLEEFGLPEDLIEYPLFGIVSRLVEQKGFDLAAEIVPDIAAHGGALVVLGTGDPAIEKNFLDLAKQFPERVSVKIDFQESLAHKIEAGSDFFLMPSRFEPCGLNQLYSLKYGTPPVVRAVGGLDDTVKEFYPKSERGNGFKFNETLPEALLKSVAKAMDVYSNPKWLSAIRKNAMAEDYSWTKQGRKYVMLYNRLLKEKKQAD